MNKTAIKNFAIWARNKLIADIQYRAGLMGITAEGIKNALAQSTPNMEFYDIGTAEPYSITGEAIQQRQKLVEILRQKEKESDYSTAYKYILEEVAYTWFNRLIAIRFMEVNDYLPSHIRVLSSESGKVEPDLVTTPFDAELDFTHDEEETILRLKTDNALDELFRLLFIKQCNALNEILPALFEKTNDYTELLLNLSVVDQDGVVYHLIHDIDENDFNIEKGGQVEIIGWLYQYYNTELNELVYDGSMSRSKISKELLPAATTIYTPDWAVRYMVQNSLGRLFIDKRKNEGVFADGRGLDEMTWDEAEEKRIDTEKHLAEQMEWKYYLPEAAQTKEVHEQLDKIQQQSEYKDVRDIKVIDPCMGSGHILVYAFDVLMQMYEDAGYSQRDAAKSILENNLYGLDIDDRAYQLAYFAVMMKARQYNRRILNGETTCHVYAIQESNNINRAHLKYLGAGMDDLEVNTARVQLEGLLDTLRDAKEYGSILKVESCNWELLRRFVSSADAGTQISLDSTGLEVTVEQLMTLIDIAETMAQKYDVVVTNPPYLGSSRFSPTLDKYVKENYDNVKNDLSMVMYKTAISNFAKNGGLIAFITTSSWMFLSSFEKLRSFLNNTVSLYNLVDFGTELFDGKVGHNPIVAWVTKKPKLDYNMTAIRLVDYCYSRRDEKEAEFFNPKNRYTALQSNFSKIPGRPVAYWVSDKFIESFRYPSLKTIARARSGAKTGKNDLFIREWWEPSFSNIKLDCQDYADCLESEAKWFPYNKGGEARNWYGNRDLVVDFEHGGANIREYSKRFGTSIDLNATDVYFKQGITWTALTSSRNTFRFSPAGCAFDTNKGPMVFSNDITTIHFLLGFFVSKVAQFYLKVFNPSLSLQNGDMDNLPIISARVCEIDEVVRLNIKKSKIDWDSFETSWDFAKHPLIRSVPTVAGAFAQWNAECNDRFTQLKGNEEELNRIFIDIYGLQDELSPEVEDKDVTVRKADLQREIKSLLSYAVGCMFGRYSLDKHGLVFAGGNFDSVYWKFKGQAALNEQGDPIDGGYAGISLANYHYPKFRDAANWEEATSLAYEPDVDGIIPITDEEYLGDDIVTRLCSWLKVVYGEDTLEENLDFIAKALGGKGNSSREIIRSYFLKDFFKDHCKIYQKRPIYWLFDSGKQNGFKALIYLHRYTPDTIGNLRVDYLHKMQRVYESEIGRMQDMIDHSTNAREVAAATKRKEKLQKQLKECREYDEMIGHLALSRTALDLDDGVKVNYEKIQTASDGKKYPVLAKI